MLLAMRLISCGVVVNEHLRGGVGAGFEGPKKGPKFACLGREQNQNIASFACRCLPGVLVFGVPEPEQKGKAWAHISSGSIGPPETQCRYGSSGFEVVKSLQAGDGNGTVDHPRMCSVGPRNPRRNALTVSEIESSVKRLN